MNKKIILIVVTLCVTVSLQAQITQEQKTRMLNDIERFGRALISVSTNYIDTVNTTAIVDRAIADMFQSLDPHSTYIPAKDLQAVNEPLDGSFQGIGIEFAIMKDTLVVQSTVSGGPSEAVGLRGGDRIIKVDGVDISGGTLSNAKVHSCLRGPKGTKVDVGVLRRGLTDTLYFTITRDAIPLNSVDASYLSNGIVYVKLGRFAMNTIDDLVEAFKVTKYYPKGVILDLRGNTGGFLHSALMVSDFFLSRGQTILYSEGLNTPKREEAATGQGPYQNGPMVVLIDENSASASEIVAGALQDWDRAIIVGRRSFGKGLVQQSFPLDDGSELRLTIARYHTPTGRVIQSPYREGHSKDYYQAAYDRLVRGEPFHRDSIHFPDSLKYQTLKQHRTVYGGGGIMPDVFVPMDTTGYSPYYLSLVSRGLINDYVNQYCDDHRAQLKKQYPDFTQFDKKYSLEKELFYGMVQYASEHGLPSDQLQIDSSQRLIKVVLKALVARSLFGTTGYYHVINNENDGAFQKAVEIIEHWPSTFPSL
ncbi:MAG: S41 family peptidase [Bacteroidales bacterium]